MRQQPQPDTLWEMVRQGHSAAFRTLFDTYWEALYLYAVRVLKDDSAAQDTIQGLFVHLWESHAELPPVTSVSAYLRSALRNRLLNAIRDEQLYQQHVGSFGLPPTPQMIPSSMPFTSAKQRPPSYALSSSYPHA